jgi:hypothetical protein
MPAKSRVGKDFIEFSKDGTFGSDGPSTNSFRLKASGSGASQTLSLQQGAGSAVMALDGVGALTAASAAVAGLVDAGTLAAGSADQFTVDASGNVGGGTGTFTGLVDAGTLQAGSADQFSVDADGHVGGVNGTFSGALQSGSSNQFTVDASGNVSAGTGAFSGQVTQSTAPTADGHLANKAYVDSVAEGLDAKASCRAGSTGTLSDFGAYTSGVFTESAATGALSIDGVALANDDRLLLKDQSAAGENGIYVVSGIDGASAVVLTRADDMNEATEVAGAYSLCTEGTVNANIGFVVISPNSDTGVTVGTTNITWSEFSGVQTVTAGDGLQRSANQLKVHLKTDGGLVIDAGVIAIDLAATSITGQLAGTDIADDAITLAKMASIDYGSLIVGDASSNPSALVKGAADTVLMSNGTNVSYGKVTSDMIQSDTIVDGDISASAAIAISKLAARTISGKDLGQSLGALTASNDGGISMSSYDGSGAGVSDLAIDFASQTGLEVEGGEGLRLKTAIAGDGIEMAAAGQVLSLTVDDTGGGDGASGLQVGVQGLKIAANKVVTAMLADDAVDKAKLAEDCAGAGLAQNVDGSLELDLNELDTKSGAPAAADTFAMVDSEASDASKRMTFATFGSALAGDGLSAAAGVMALDLHELTAVDAAPEDADFLPFVDSSDGNATKKLTVTNLSKAVFAKVVGGDATIDAEGALTIAADAVQTGMVHDDVAETLAGVGLTAATGVMALHLSELAEAAVTVASDSIPFITGGGETRQESVADLVDAMVAGQTTIAAASGVLSVPAVTVGTTAILPGASSTAVEGLASLTGATATGLTLAAGGTAKDILLQPSTSGKVEIQGDTPEITSKAGAALKLTSKGGQNIQLIPDGSGQVQVGGAHKLYAESGTTMSFGFSDSCRVAFTKTDGESGVNEADFSSSTEVLGKEFTATSDMRLKFDFEQIPDASKKLMQLKGYNFKWKGNESQSGGCGAQEVQAVFPEAVKEVQDEQLGSVLKLQYNSLIGLLIEGWKDQQKEIQQLKEQMEHIKKNACKCE